LHWVITTKKELLPQIKADKGKGEKNNPFLSIFIISAHLR
jgi:hypothetical protein